MYQENGSERDSAAERMIANELKILSDPNLQYTLGLSKDEIDYIAYAVRMHALSVAKNIINNEKLKETYRLASEQILESKQQMTTEDSNEKSNQFGK